MVDGVEQESGSSEVRPESRPRLRPGSRLSYDHVRDTDVLLFPEGVLVLNHTAAAVLSHCDGRRTVLDIVAQLGERFRGVRLSDVTTLLAQLRQRHLIETAGEARDA
nr:pyrroloquinoline quinone biosynthesis peptide chaperone PqqD [Longimycelium tulufanense]